MNIFKKITISLKATSKNQISVQPLITVKVRYQYVSKHIYSYYSKLTTLYRLQYVQKFVLILCVTSVTTVSVCDSESKYSVNTPGEYSTKPGKNCNKINDSNAN